MGSCLIPYSVTSWSYIGVRECSISPLVGGEIQGMGRTICGMLLFSLIQQKRLHWFTRMIRVGRWGGGEAVAVYIKSLPPRNHQACEQTSPNLKLSITLHGSPLCK